MQNPVILQKLNKSEIEANKKERLPSVFFLNLIPNIGSRFDRVITSQCKFSYADNEFLLQVNSKLCILCTLLIYILCVN